MNKIQNPKSKVKKFLWFFTFYFLIFNRKSRLLLLLVAMFLLFTLLATYYWLLATPAYAVDIGSTYLGAGFQSFGELISTSLNFIFGLAFAMTFFLVLFGGIKFMTSGGDEKAVAGARGLITSALIGLVLVFVAYWIIKLVQRLTGLEGTGIFL